MGHSEGNPERKVHSDTSLPKTETFQINNLTLHLHLQEGGELQTKARASRRKKITKT